MIDLSNVTLAGLMAIGVVNVLTMFKPELDSKIKFITSLIVAFAITFVPLELGSIILDHLKSAIEVAFAASGAYKIAQKVGGN
jgi:hypothetical protein